MVLLVEVGNKGTGIVICCQPVRRGILLVWLTVACVGIDGLAGAGFCHGYLCGCTLELRRQGAVISRRFCSLVMEGGAWTAGAVAHKS